MTLTPHPRRVSERTSTYLGTVTRVDGSTAYVEVPFLTADYEFPARYPAEYGDSRTTDYAGGPTDPAHVHHVVPLPPLSAGDDVAVAFLNDSDEELVILIRLA